MSDKTVYAIILNWNHLDDLKETIISFRKQDYENLNIIVSDNGSTDNSVSWLKTNHPEITVLENNANLGWAEGNNVGIRYALEQNADYILLANNDLYFDNSELISILVADLEHLNGKKIKIIGTNVYYYNQKEKLHNSGWITEKNGKSFNIFRADYEPEISKKYRVVDYVSGCFMLIEDSVFDEIGLFDESYFMYGEESDFSFRAWGKGLASAINTEVQIYHKIAATSLVSSPFSVYLKNRNLFYFYNKHKKKIKFINYYKYLYFKGYIKNIIKAIFFPSKFNGSYFKILKALLKGLTDGILKKMGKPGKFINK